MISRRSPLRRTAPSGKGEQHKGRLTLARRRWRSLHEFTMRKGNRRAQTLRGAKKAHAQYEGHRSGSLLRRKT